MNDPHLASPVCNQLALCLSTNHHTTERHQFRYRPNARACPKLQYVFELHSVTNIGPSVRVYARMRRLLATMRRRVRFVTVPPQRSIIPERPLLRDIPTTGSTSAQLQRSLSKVTPVRSGKRRLPPDAQMHRSRVVIEQNGSTTVFERTLTECSTSNVTG